VIAAKIFAWFANWNFAPWRLGVFARLKILEISLQRYTGNGRDFFNTEEKIFINNSVISSAFLRGGNGGIY